MPCILPSIRWPRRAMSCPHRHTRSTAIAIAIWAGSSSAEAPRESIDRERVIAIARGRAPSVLRAQSRVRFAEAELASAGRLSTQNPTVQVRGGPRLRPGSVSPDVGLTGWLPVPLLLDRAKSLQAARAGVREAELEVEVVRLGAVAVALDLYVRVLFAKEQLALAGDRADLGEELLKTARARERAGDASRLDVELAQAENAASAANVLAARAGLSAALQNLTLALGLSSLAPEDVNGALSAQRRLPAPLKSSVDELVAAAQEARPDLLAADASLARARADRDRAGYGWLPKVSVGAGYEFEEGAHIPTVGLRTTLPVFDNDQGGRARADAAIAATAREVELRRAALHAEVLQAAAIHRDALAASKLLEERGLDHALEASRLAAVSYAAGKTDIGAVLLVRSGTLAIRSEHLDRLLDASLAANRVGLVVGVLGRPNEPTKPERNEP